MVQVLAIFWASCGIFAFATYVVRRRDRLKGNWGELPFQFIAATILGVIALIGVLTNKEV
jgi:hypothetical protein